MSFTDAQQGFTVQEIELQIKTSAYMSYVRVSNQDTLLKGTASSTVLALFCYSSGLIQEC